MGEYEFRLPKFGMTMQEGTVEEWCVGEGDAIAEGQELVVISTDKVDDAVGSPVAGTVARILVAPGTTVETGTVLAIITQ